MSFVTPEVMVDGAQYIALYSDNNHDNVAYFSLDLIQCNKFV